MGLPARLQAFSMAFSDSGIQGYYDNGRGLTGAWDTGRIPGDELKEVLADVDKLLNVLVLTDDDVEAQNRVALSSLPGDENGPIPKVIFRQRQRTQRTLANREYCADKASRLLRAAGARKVIRLDWPPLILHVQSTMRMGSDSADSVLDPSGEARFADRVFVASNAALANSLGGPNPTLTTQALATRTAERIVQRYFGGEAWVGVEEPISSIDDAVTQAVIDRGL